MTEEGLLLLTPPTAKDPALQPADPSVATIPGSGAVSLMAWAQSVQLSVGQIVDGRCCGDALHHLDALEAGVLSL